MSVTAAIAPNSRPTAGPVGSVRPGEGKGTFGSLLRGEDPKPESSPDSMSVAAAPMLTIGGLSVPLGSVTRGRAPASDA